MSSGDDAFGEFGAHEVTPGVWDIAPSLIGPDTAPQSGTVNTGMAAQRREFDTTVTSSTGDLELGDVDASPPPATPVEVDPGQTVSIPVTFTPTAANGTVVSGDLFVDDALVSPFTGAADELTAIPYRYKVGSATP